MSSIFHKINENQVLDLMKTDSKIDKNIVITGIDEDSMARFTGELSTQPSLENGNFLINMNASELKRIKNAMNGNKNGKTKSLFDGRVELLSSQLEKEKELLKSAEAERKNNEEKEKKLQNEIKRIKNRLGSMVFSLYEIFISSLNDMGPNSLIEEHARVKMILDQTEEETKKDKQIEAEIRKKIKYTMNQLGIEEIIKNSHQLTLSSRLSEEYLMGKLFEAFSSHSAVFNALGIKDYDLKLQHYRSLLDSNDVDAEELKRAYSSNGAFSWVFDGLTNFSRLNGMRVVGWIPNFQYISNPVLYDTINGIITKSSDAIRFIVLTGASHKGTYELFKSLNNPFYAISSDGGYKYMTFSRKK